MDIHRPENDFPRGTADALFRSPTELTRRTALLERELLFQEIDCFEHLALKFCAFDFLDSLGARYRER